jgi:hypothetical protein
MKRIILSAVMAMFASLGLAVETGGIGVPEMAKWDATHYVSVSYKDITAAASNVAVTLTNVFKINAGESCELAAFVLDEAFEGAAHSNAWTNSIALTVTDAGGTNSIMGSTEIHADSTEVWLKLPRVLSSVTYISGLMENSPGSTGQVIAATSTVVVATIPAGNKYYTGANYVSLTFTPTDNPQIMSNSTSGKFRLFFRKLKSKD